MNEKVDLTKILKDCPKGTKLYSPLCGEVVFECISDSIVYPIFTTDSHNSSRSFSKEGFYNATYTDAECLLFPSAEQRDWRKFKAPCLKKKKFDPNTLQPFDKVLVRDYEDCKWKVDFYSYKEVCSGFPYICIGSMHKYCIPYNDGTKHLVGKADEAPEYYKYWED